MTVPRTVRCLILLHLLLLLLSVIQASAQGSGILTAGLSHNVNWMPESDAFTTFRSSTSSEATSLASLGSEVIIGYEMFIGAAFPDSTPSAGVYLQAGYLQRGYRVAMISGSECFSDEGYHVRSSSLRLTLLGRKHISMVPGTSLVLQIGGAFGQLLSVNDNVAEVQFCEVPTEAVETVMPKSFVEAGGGVGIRRRIGPHMVGSADLVYFYPLAVTSSGMRPSADTQVRGLLVDLKTPNLAVTLGIGWMF